MPEATPREKELSEELDRATSELASARTEIKLLREKIDALEARLVQVDKSGAASDPGASPRDQCRSTSSASPAAPQNAFQNLNSSAPTARWRPSAVR